MPYSAVKFASYEHLKNLHYLSKSGEKNTKLENFVNGGLASLFTVLITHPTDVVRRTVQANVSLGESGRKWYLQAVRDIYRKEGLGGFYNGLVVTCVKIFPTMGLAFMVNEYMRALLRVK
jgi:hypothetical protein